MVPFWHHRGGRHHECDDWCPAKTGKPVKNILPLFVLDAIKPVFEALTDENLLKKRLRGGSQGPYVRKCASASSELSCVLSLVHN